MHRLVITVTALCALAAATPARAFGDLQNCDAIKDAGERMTCLYAHIAHLEQTLLSFSTDITDLRRALKEKVDANGVYKLQYVGKGNLPRLCRQRQAAGVSELRPPRFVEARPRIGSRLKAPSPRRRRRIHPTRTNRPTKVRVRTKTRTGTRASRRTNPRPMLSLRPRLSLRPYPKPQPSL